MKKIIPKAKTPKKPAIMTAEIVRQIIMQTLKELGCLDLVPDELVDVITKAKDVQKRAKDFQKSVNDENMLLKSRLDSLVSRLEELQKRRMGSGFIIRDRAGGDRQQIQALKDTLPNIADTFVKQQVQNEIARLEIKAVRRAM